MRIVSFVAAALLLLLSGCSSKQYYKPKEVAGEWEKRGDVKESIIDSTHEIALLEDRRVLVEGGELNVTIPQDERVVGYSDGWVITTGMDGNLTLRLGQDANLSESFELKKTIAAATVKGDILAVLFANNEMALYAISTKELLFKEQGNAPVIINAKTQNPYFMNDLVLFFTLDGKVSVVNSTIKKRLRTVIVSSEQHFNNIISFGIVDNTIIATSGYSLLSLAAKELRAKYEVRCAAYKGGTIFIASKQGEIVALSADMQVKAKLKFPFAHFLGMLATDEKLYALEKGGYLIEMPLDLSTSNVYEASVDEGYLFMSRDRFYIDDEYISLQ